MATAMPKRDKPPVTSGMQYAALATQMLVIIGGSVFLGLKADGWLRLRFPLLVWLLPLLMLVALLVKIVKDTSKK
jgi:hypothetical protein